jgi:hypothetical protein
VSKRKIYTINLHGEQLSGNLTQIARAVGINYNTLCTRIHKGIPLEEAILIQTKPYNAATLDIIKDGKTYTGSYTYLAKTLHLNMSTIYAKTRKQPDKKVWDYKDFIIHGNSKKYALKLDGSSTKEYTLLELSHMYNIPVATLRTHSNNLEDFIKKSNRNKEYKDSKVYTVTHNGKTYKGTITSIIKQADIKIAPPLVYLRLHKYKWDIEKAFFKPVNYRGYHWRYVYRDTNGKIGFREDFNNMDISLRKVVPIYKVKLENNKNKLEDAIEKVVLTRQNIASRRVYA